MTQVGWVVDGGNPVKLAQANTLQVTALAYPAMLAGATVTGTFIRQTARTCDANPDLTQYIVFAVYDVTPLFIVGLAMLYPHF